jgi:DNA-binding NtrC family response regulator
LNKYSAIILDDLPSSTKDVVEVLKNHPRIDANRICETQRPLSKKTDSIASYNLIFLDLDFGSIGEKGYDINTGYNLFKQIREVQDPDVPPPRIIILSSFAALSEPFKKLVSGEDQSIPGPDEVCQKKNDPAIFNFVINRCIARLDSDRKQVSQKLAIVEAARVQQTGKLPTRLADYFENALLGASDAMKYLRQQIEIHGPSNSSILITGSSGSGKELVARAIHIASSQSAGPFAPINLAGLDINIANSELFGHKKGAFTGAISDKVGLVEQANSGTLFLDEVGDVPISIQINLLRVLQERVYRRVGDIVELPLNCRIIFATNKNLYQEVQKGTFRDDFLSRIEMPRIKVPSLSERIDDIPLLVNHIANKYIESSKLKGSFTFSDEAIAELQNYDWPRNIRELIGVVHTVLNVARYYKKDVIPQEYVLDCLNSDDSPVSNISKQMGPLERLAEMNKEVIRQRVSGKMSESAICEIVGYGNRSLKLRFVNAKGPTALGALLEFIAELKGSKPRLWEKWPE